MSSVQTTAHYRILAFPVQETPAGGLLESLQLERHGDRNDLVFDYHGLRRTQKPLLFEQDGRPWEHIRGEYLPRRLRFVDINLIQGEKINFSLEGRPPKDPDRRLYSELAWRSPEGQNHYLIDLHRKNDDTLLLTAGGCLAEDRNGPIWKTEFDREWCPPPPAKARLVPWPRRLWQRYGGDPITIRLDGQEKSLQLFVGGLDTQSKQRPQVGAELNLGDQPSTWCEDESVYPSDRRAQKGEGSRGMSSNDLAEEAGWVIDHLRSGERVLVHCSAGMNRSASVCCAALILLEGLSAEASLERVREHHPWARPDPRHWLALRWLASSRGIPD